MRLHQRKDETVWNAPLGFLRGGTLDYWDPYNNNAVPIHWEFERLSGPRNSSVSMCSMSGWNIVEWGYGDGFLLEPAVRISFAEAWERLWFERCLHDQKHFPEFRNRESTSGFAAGISESDSEIRAKRELLEHAIYLKAWTERRGWRKYRPSGFHARYVLPAVTPPGWTIYWFEICSVSDGSVLFILAIHPTLGTLCDLTYVCDFPSAEKKMVLSIIRALHLPRPQPLRELPESAGPRDHASFYSDPNHNEAYHFLLTMTDLPHRPVDLKGADLISARLLCEAGDFPAISVASHPDWPELRWGLQAITGENPWPHPLA